MTFLFFNFAGAILFERSDAESASVVHEEMSLQALFPYDPAKIIQRGMRIGYKDALGVFQVYEIRKVKTYEPDHYQEVTAEHICISELTDEFYADNTFTDTTASAALTALLTNTLWSVGTSSVSNTSSVKITNGNVWADIRTVEKNWNVRILPRVTVDSTGITGRYLDITGADGTWRGLRLSLDKNADEVGVTWDDSKLKTALYAFGKSVEQTISGQKVTKPITLETAEWSETAEHPAKPLGQAYLEDTAATAAYGRNGRARFAYYQNGDISDPQILLEKTWESLQTLNHPDVTVDCLVCDLYRLGYVDVPLRLYDTALVEIRPTGAVVTKQIIQYTEDLLDPTQSRVCIGTYIPNIVYIARETEKAAGGGGGGGGGQPDAEYQRKEFETSIAYNEYQISMRATQYDLNQTNMNVAAAQAQINIDKTGIASLVTGTGAQLNADGTLVTDSHGNPIFVTTGGGLYSKINQNANSISLIVSNVGANGTVTAASIVAAVNSAGSSVIIDADHIDLNGIVTAQQFETALASIDTLTGDLDVYGSVTIGGHLSAGDINAESLSGYKVDGTSIGLGDAVSDLRITSSGSTYTLQKKTLGDGSWTDVGNFSRAGSIDSIQKVSQTWKPAYFDHGGWDVVCNAYGTGVAPYSGTIQVDGAYAYTAGWVEGYDDGFAEFTLTTVTPQGASETVYVDDPTNGTTYYTAGSSVTYRQAGSKMSKVTMYGSGSSVTRVGTSHNYTYYGQLYSFNSGTYTLQGTGTWYLWSNNHTSDKLYEAGTSVYTRGTQNDNCYVEDPNGAYLMAGSAVTVTPIGSTHIKVSQDTRYAAGTTVSDTYYTKTS